MQVLVDIVRRMLTMLEAKVVERKGRIRRLLLPRNILYVVTAERVVACRRFGFHSSVIAFSSVTKWRVWKRRTQMESVRRERLPILW